MTKERLRIAFFTNTYHPDVNGVVRSVDSFQKSLTDIGHNVFVFAQGTRNYVDKQPFVFRYPAVKPIKKFDYSLTLPKSRFVSRAIESLMPEVIHSHHPVALGRAAASKAEDLNIPLIATLHTQYSEYTHYVPFYQPWVKKTLNHYLKGYWSQCQHILVPSSTLKDELDKNGISGKISTMPTIIDTEPFKKADSKKVREKRKWGDDFVIISIGRMAKEKNFPTVIKAFSRIAKGKDNIRLVLIGDGDQKVNLEKLTRKLNIEDKVEFTGRVHFSDIPYYLKASNLFAFASVTETQGIVTMEAMAADLPVVAVDGMGTRDIIDDGVNGFLTKNKPRNLANAMSAVVDNSEMYERLKEGAIKTAATFDQNLQAKKLVDIYHEAIEDKKRGYHISVK